MAWKATHQRSWVLFCVCVTVGPFLRDVERLFVVKPSASLTPVRHSNPRRPSVKKHVSPPRQNIKPLPTFALLRIVSPVMEKSLVLLAGDSQPISKNYPVKRSYDPVVGKTVRISTNETVRAGGQASGERSGTERPLEALRNEDAIVAQPEILVHQSVVTQPTMIEGGRYNEPKAGNASIPHPPAPSSSAPILDYTIIEENEAVVLVAEVPPVFRTTFDEFNLVFHLVIIDTDGRAHTADSDGVTLSDRNITHFGAPIQARFNGMTRERVHVVKLIVTPSF